MVTYLMCAKGRLGGGGGLGGGASAYVVLTANLDLQQARTAKSPILERKPLKNRVRNTESHAASNALIAMQSSFECSL